MHLELRPDVAAATAAALRAADMPAGRVPLPPPGALPPHLQATLRRVLDREEAVTTQASALVRHHAEALDALASAVQQADAPLPAVVA